MRVQKIRNTLGKGLGLALTAALSIGLLSAPAQAEVHVNVNIGTPPPIFIHSAPRLVYLPEPALYVAVGIPYDVYFVSGRYYHYWGSNWYWSPGYGGPWTYVTYRSLPPGLRKFKVDRLHYYRDREYRSYPVYRDDYRRDYRSDRYVSFDRSPKAKGHGRGHGKH